ncbi:MAG: hypothetical protein LWX07_10590 [Bacteroidetes bacterium]|nr:hypothetical protein [Bacteroidota bacterium]
MKIRFAFIIFILFTSFLYSHEQYESKPFYGNKGSGSPANNPTPLNYYKCPKCDNIVSRISSPSYNTAGAKHYTDGKITGTLYRERPEAVICENCKYPFWMKDDYADPNCYQSLLFATSENELVMKAQKSVFYGPETYDKFIRNHVYCGREEEKYLLTRYWLALNDKVRNRLAFFTDPCDNDTARANLSRLIQILEEENDELMNIAGNAEGDNFERNKLIAMSMKTVTEIFGRIRDIYTFTGIISDGFSGTIKILTKEFLKRLKSTNIANYESVNWNLLTIAELNRNLGRFEQCSDAVSLIESENHLLRKAAGEIRDLCENKIRLVSEM